MNEHKIINRENIVSALELPKDILLGFATLNLIGNRQLIIQNHKGILFFDSKQAVVLTKSFQIVVDGNDLLVPCFSDDMLEITGRIDSVAFRP